MTDRELQTLLMQLACDVANGKITHEQAEEKRLQLGIKRIEKSNANQ